MGTDLRVAPADLDSLGIQCCQGVNRLEVGKTRCMRDFLQILRGFDSLKSLRSLSIKVTGKVSEAREFSRIIQDLSASLTTVEVRVVNKLRTFEQIETGGYTYTVTLNLCDSY